MFYVTHAVAHTSFSLQRFLQSSSSAFFSLSPGYRFSRHLNHSSPASKFLGNLQDGLQPSFIVRTVTYHRIRCESSASIVVHPTMTYHRRPRYRQQTRSHRRKHSMVSTDLHCIARDGYSIIGGGLSGCPDRAMRCLLRTPPPAASVRRSVGFSGSSSGEISHEKAMASYPFYIETTHSTSGVWFMVDGCYSEQI